MKKLLVFACVSLLILASCGNKTKSNVEGVDSLSDSVEVVAGDVQSMVTDVTSKLTNADPTVVTGALESIKTTYAELVKEGKLEEAKQYASAVQKFVAENSDKLSAAASGNTTVVSLIEGIKNLPTSAETTAEQAAAAVKADAKAAVEGAGEAAKAAAVEKATQAAAPVVEKAAETKAAVDAAKVKADEKVNQANATVDAAKKLLGK